MRNAKELCAMLITRQLKTLSEDEEDVVVDYLDDLGIDVDIDAKPREICMTLLDKVMEKDLGRRVPITAYANTLLSKEESAKDIKEKQKEERKLQNKRKNKKEKLNKNKDNLIGCVTDPNLSIPRNQIFEFRTAQNLGIKTTNGKQYYAAVVTVSQQLYQRIFSSVSNPILELRTHRQDRGYVRIEGTNHDNNENMIYVSPLVSQMLDFGTYSHGYVRICVTMPEVKKVDFTYYGSKAALTNDMEKLLTGLPPIINAFSVLKLGMELLVPIDDKVVTVRVDKLYDNEKDSIFAGVIPFGETDLPFDIEADE